MRKFVLGLAALAAIGVAMPCVAQADEVVVHKHRHHIYNEAMPDHHHHNDKTIVKHDHD